MDNHYLFSFPSLKMLVVLHATPAATPTKTVRFERLFAKVVVVDFVGELFASVHIIGGCGRTDARAFDTGILQWVDVDSHTEGMLREPPRAGYGAVVEARTIVGLHGGLVGSVEVVHQSDTIDGISLCKQGPEDAEQVVGDGLVAHHLALLDVIVEVVIIEGEITEVVIAYVGLVLHRLALHPGSHFLENGLGGEYIAMITQGVFGLEGDRSDRFLYGNGVLHFGGHWFSGPALGIATARGQETKT